MNQLHPWNHRPADHTLYVKNAFRSPVTKKQLNKALMEQGVFATTDNRAELLVTLRKAEEENEDIDSKEKGEIERSKRKQVDVQPTAWTEMNYGGRKIVLEAVSREEKKNMDHHDSPPPAAKSKAKKKMARCGLCDHPFALENLPGSVTQRAVWTLREKWGIPIPERKRRWLNALYGQIKLCLFCMQFFEVGGEKATCGNSCCCGNCEQCFDEIDMTPEPRAEDVCTDLNAKRLIFADKDDNEETPAVEEEFISSESRNAFSRMWKRMKTIDIEGPRRPGSSMSNAINSRLLGSGNANSRFSLASGNSRHRPQSARLWRSRSPRSRSPRSPRASTPSVGGPMKLRNGGGRMSPRYSYSARQPRRNPRFSQHDGQPSRCATPQSVGSHFDPTDLDLEFGDLTEFSIHSSTERLDFGNSMSRSSLGSNGRPQTSRSRSPRHRKSQKLMTPIPKLNLPASVTGSSQVVRPSPLRHQSPLVSPKRPHQRPGAPSRTVSALATARRPTVPASPRTRNTPRKSKRSSAAQREQMAQSARLSSAGARHNHPAVPPQPKLGSGVDTQNSENIDTPSRKTRREARSAQIFQAFGVSKEDLNNVNSPSTLGRKQMKRPIRPASTPLTDRPRIENNEISKSVSPEPQPQLSVITDEGSKEESLANEILNASSIVTNNSQHNAAPIKISSKPNAKSKSTPATPLGTNMGSKRPSFNFKQSDDKKASSSSTKQQQQPQQQQSNKPIAVSATTKKNSFHDEVDDAFEDTFDSFNDDAFEDSLNIDDNKNKKPTDKSKNEDFKPFVSIKKKDSKPVEKKDSKPIDKKDVKPIEKKDSKPIEKKDSKPIEKKDPKSVDKKDSKPTEKKNSPIEKKDSKPIEKKDVKPIEKDSKPIEKKDSKPIEKKDSKPIEKKDSKPIEKKDVKPIEKNDSKPIEKKDSKPIGKKDSKPIEKKDSKPIEKKDSKPIEKDSKPIEKKDSKPIEKKDVKPIEKDSEPIEKKPVDKKDIKPIEKKPIEKKDDKPVEKKDVKPIEKDSKPIEKNDSKPIEKKPVDKKDIKPIEKKPIEKKDSKPIEKKDSKPVEKKDVKPIEKKDVKPIDKKDIKPIEKDSPVSSNKADLDDDDFVLSDDDDM